jgi:hypothetical protein
MQYTAQMASLSFLYSVYVTPKNMKRFYIPRTGHASPSDYAILLLCQKLAILSHNIHMFLLLSLYNSHLSSTDNHRLECTMQRLFLTLLLIVRGFNFFAEKSSWDSPATNSPESSHSSPATYSNSIGFSGNSLIRKQLKFSRSSLTKATEILPQQLSQNQLVFSRDSLTPKT